MEKFQRGFTWFPIILVASVIIIFGLTQLFPQSIPNFLNSKPQSVAEENISNVASVPESKNPDDWRQDLQDLLKDIYSGKINYTKKRGDVPYFEKTFSIEKQEDFDRGIISVTVHKYTPGSSYPIDFEGRMPGTYNLDVHVNALLSLKPGSEYSKQLGSRIFSSDDSYFPPSRTWSRNYTTFDKDTSQLIEAGFGFQNLSAEFEKSGYVMSGDKYHPYKVIKYPPQVNQILSIIDEILSSY